MCGICGIYNFGSSAFKVDSELMVRMRDTMLHRGPDAAGVWINSDQRVGFGHRRLSIIDLASAANQPMSNEDGSIWIVYNGEIYNHEEIRKILVIKGHKFKTDHSDTEVIVHAFEEWKEDCVQKFRGMFAFSVWDDKRKELWLFRDRLGIKPLYYTISNGRFIFASEIKAILSFPDLRREVNEEGLYHYLSFLTVPAPETLFKGIMKLTSGFYLKLDSYGEIKTKRYWDVLEQTKPLVHNSEHEVADFLLEELKTSIKYRKIADVPVGVFLSGGIDSSANAVLFSEGQKNQIKTFSIGYDQEYSSYQNEFSYARIIAQLVGATQYEKKITAKEFIDFLPKLIYFQDEPIADPVCVPLYYLSQLAKSNGVTVCQVGEGSDELFWGYPHWKTILQLQKISRIPLTLPLKRLGQFLIKQMGNTYKMPYEWLRRSTADEPIFWGGAEGFTETEKKEIFSERLKKKFKARSSFEILEPIYKNFKEKAWEPTALNWMSYLDINLRLPELLLMRVDKMSMATSLEARVPFLDHKFVELAMSIPEAMKTKNGELKHILKKAVKNILPQKILTRPKQGFNVPVYEWLSDALGDFAKNKIRKFTERTDIFNAEYMHRLITADSGVRLWYILNFVMWYEFWIEGDISGQAVCLNN